MKASKVIASSVVAFVCSSIMYGMQADPGSAAMDKEFLMKASEGSMAEIQMSKLALKKGNDGEVKQIAQKMIDDHTMLLQNMKPIADQLGVMPPRQLNSKHKQEQERLKAQSGKDFDKEYVTAMVGDHHHDLGDFQAEQTTTTNPQLKAAVTQGTQVIRTHTEMIDQVAQKMSIPTPPMPEQSPSM